MRAAKLLAHQNASSVSEWNTNVPHPTWLGKDVRQPGSGDLRDNLYQLPRNRDAGIGLLLFIAGRILE